MPMLLKLYKCCVHALKICTWLGYTPQIKFFFLLFFASLNLVIFGHFHIEKPVPLLDYQSSIWGHKDYIVMDTVQNTAVKYF